ncbi:hypothetical protein EVJ58_g8775 [Rhodofomes roseus]|uniref:Uncharacterized protein n=1 Tax=Rhodofomes roseus TaxID=34475 RepID=A0A4Y9XWU3_9APHY|nr:hypothetical protein EVJ58_g8775 [Rhodofomes roseus]
MFEERVVEEVRTKIEGLDLLYALRECAIKQIVELYVENGQDANAVPKAKHADAQEASRKRSLSGAPDDGIAADPKRRCSKLRLEHRGNAETLHTSFTGSGIGGALNDPPPKHHAGLDSLSIEQADSLLGASHSGTLVVTKVPPKFNDPETRLFSHRDSSDVEDLQSNSADGSTHSHDGGVSITKSADRVINPESSSGSQALVAVASREISSPGSLSGDDWYDNTQGITMGSAEKPIRIQHSSTRPVFRCDNISARITTLVEDMEAAKEDKLRLEAKAIILEAEVMACKQEKEILGQEVFGSIERTRSILNQLQGTLADVTTMQADVRLRYDRPDARRLRRESAHT